MTVKVVQLICDNCGKLFERRAALHTQNIERGRIRIFCTVICSSEYRILPQGTYICQNELCAKKFSRRKKTRDFLKYCSLTCAAINNNKNRVRVRKEGNSLRRRTLKACLRCGKERESRTDLCRNCISLEFLETTTIEEYTIGLKTAHRHAKVRSHARGQYVGPLECLNCGYSLHVEIAHIKALKDFPLTAKLGEVNHPSNLIALDRRCHWEYDNGYLQYIDGKLLPIIK